MLEASDLVERKKKSTSLHVCLLVVEALPFLYNIIQFNLTEKL